VLALAGAGWLSLRPSAERSSVEPPRSLPVQPSPPATPARPAPAAATALPLTAADPNDAQLKQLLEAWLQAKAARLAGDADGSELQNLARPSLISGLERQVAENRSRGEREEITATITALQIDERSPQRLAASVLLNYSDTRLNQDGKVLNRTPSRTLRNQYVFGRDGGIWRVAAFRPAG
jgi:predicted lipid-binding transport protein (Tim44 family)